MVLNNITDKVNVQNSNGEDVLQDIAGVETTSWSINPNTEKLSAIGFGAEYPSFTNGLKTSDVSLEFYTDTLESLKLIGDYDSNNDTITFNDELPIFDYKSLTQENETIGINGCKFGRLEINLDREGVLKVNVDGQGTSYSNPSSTITQTVFDKEATNWNNVTLRLDGDEVSEANNLSITIERPLETESSIGQSDDTPTSLTEGHFNVTAEVDIKTKEDYVERVLNDRTEFDVEFVNDKLGETLTLPNSLVNEVSSDRNVDDDGIRVITFSIMSRSKPEVTL